MHDDTRARLVDRLVLAEQASGLSHRRFAESIGLSETYWCHIRRRRRISLAALTTVVKARPELVLPVMNEITLVPGPLDRSWEDTGFWRKE